MRNWSAILIDAGLRGISRVELARELGIGRGQVNNACRAYGVALPEAARYMKGRVGGRTEGEIAKMRARRGRRWARWHEETPAGLSLNQFCKKWNCGYAVAEKWAAHYQYEFTLTAWKRVLRRSA